MNKYNPDIHHRRSIRLGDYDYSSRGLYFVTVCTYKRECLFGQIANNKMILNDAGKIAEKCWNEIPNHFPKVSLHRHIIMPNHIHGIIEIVGANQYSPKIPGEKYPVRANQHSPQNPRSPSQTIGSMVRGFKIGVTMWFRKNVPTRFPVGRRVWQRDYYEHIIRNDESYQKISDYIIENPTKWHSDKLR
ncbi:MAG: transposase [Bacteroidales bacterium]